MQNNHLPPADAPDWGAPYNFKWFKHHHLDNLKKCTEAIKNEYEKLDPKAELSKEIIASFLALIDKLIQFELWLPNTAGEDMDDIRKVRIKFENDCLSDAYQNGYWDMQELQLMASDLSDYMDTLCEDE